MPLWHVPQNTSPVKLPRSFLTAVALNPRVPNNEVWALHLPETRLPPESLLRGWVRLPHGPQDYGRPLASVV